MNGIRVIGLTGVGFRISTHGNEFKAGRQCRSSASEAVGSQFIQNRL
jgi:hypothetical protein